MMCADIHYEKFIGLSLLYIHVIPKICLFLLNVFFYNKTNMYSIFFIVKNYFHFDQL